MLRLMQPFAKSLRRPCRDRLPWLRFSRLVDVFCWVPTRSISSVVVGECRLPVGGCLGGDEGISNGQRLRMKPGVLDGELPHAATGKLFTVQVDCQPKMLGEHLSLFVNTRRCQRCWVSPCEQGECLLENPGVADCPPGHRQAIDPGLCEHGEAGLR